MKRTLFLIVVSLILTSTVSGQNAFTQEFVTSDIDNFWSAYDKIIATTDSAKQLSILKTQYLDKATPGLKSLLELRRYTPKEFIDAIHKYPKFWSSVRNNTLQMRSYFADMQKNISKLRLAYPTLKPATIYCSIGVFRTNGTTDKNMVLFGCESLTFNNDKLVIDEFPDWRKEYYRLYTPVENLPLLCTHEYIHTQQIESADNLFCYVVREGAAEYLSCLVTSTPSNTPCFTFAKKNEELVKRKFIEEVFIPGTLNNWMWGINRNELKERDLGYYIGYRICEKYYESAQDKGKAIKDIIELDYSNDSVVINFIDNSGFFDKSIYTYDKIYEESRPRVVNLTPFVNNSMKVKPERTTITVHFSQPLDKSSTGIDFGPLGEKFAPKIDQSQKMWSEDGMSYSFIVDLQPNRHYQLLITNNFRTKSNIRLKPYLIDITTAP
jgi:hypothetical protein